MRVTGTFILLTGVVLTTATLAAAQQTPSTTDRLLEEVRQLRLALERQVSVGARVQLITGRAAMQDERVYRVSQQLDDVRDGLVTVDRQIKELERRARGIEEVLAVESDPAHRRNAEGILRTFRADAAGHATVQESLRLREQELANALLFEQARFDELTKRLDDLERTLER